MPTHVRLELILIAILLPLVMLFAFWYVQAYVPEPKGFGSDSEVSPRFAPYLLAALMTTVMVGRLINLGLIKARDKIGDIPDDLTEIGTPTETRRGFVLNIAAAIYGFLLIPVVGFYAASFVLTVYLVHRLGEQRVMMVMGVGVACVAFNYLLFDELLNVRLPRGAIFNYFKG